MKTYDTREAWLRAATEELRPRLVAAGGTLPEKVQVTCGWPSTKALSAKNIRIGECWQASSANDGAPHVFISPRLADPVEVLDCHAHELIHACGAKGHRGPFKRIAVALGLEGKMTATHAGAHLAEELRLIAGRLGPYPHGALNPGDRPTKKQTTRLLKVACAETGYTVRVTRKWLDEAGAPLCPCCERSMEEAD